MEIKQRSVYELTLISMVAALYVVVTWLVAPFAYGQFQLRLSEGLNHLAVFNKRYIWALSLGVLIANLASPLGVIDIAFGTLGTLVMTSISYWLTQHVDKVWVKLVISTVVDTVMMWTVALEQVVVFKLPFWLSYGWLMLGELASLVLGAILIGLLSKRIDLTK
ncbi:QueT transporter family protein [Weissella kandleri]|uniref:QueT transporter family protein n=1 Tax=Weissella kandleri TaxID=1616 RepID=UPI00387E4802